MMIRITFIFSILWLAGCGSTSQTVKPESVVSPAVEQSEQPENTAEKITYEQWLLQWVEISTKPDAKIVNEDLFIYVSLPSEDSQYYFTSVMNEAYPAILKRAIFETDDNLFLATKSWYVEKTGAFDQLQAFFISENAKIAEKIRMELKQK